MLKIIFLLYCLFNRIDSVPLNEFFPYGSTVNDTIFPPNDDESTNPLSLPRLFPYFNNNHRQIYLSNNGLFSFLGPISQFTPTPFPLNDGRRLIAGFWADVDTRGYIPLGNLVYYQIYGDQNNNNKTTVFEKAATYVQEYFPSEPSFSPQMVITGTWYRVAAYNEQTSLTNTFQIVLTTDEIRSFAFLLYNDLEWTKGQVSPVDGEAGFNAGDGIVFEMLPYSRTSLVRQLVNLSNVNVAGLFVYRIDTDTITLGGCGDNSSLLFRPYRGSQLGLTPIIIQGPCFTNLTDENIKCRFGESSIVDGIIINEFEVICLTPFVSLPDFINIYLSVDNGITYQSFASMFTYTPVEFGLSLFDNLQVEIINNTDMIIITGQQITLGWYLSETTINSWSNKTIRLEIEMLNVILNETNGGIILNNSIIVDTNIIPILGYQLITIIIPSINNNLATIFFRIIARDISTNKIYLGFNSALFVLHDNTIDTTGYCQSWSQNQPLPSTWNENLLPCPLTLIQAHVAHCCYEPDPLCNQNNNCNLHQGRLNYSELSAIACYLSRTTNQWNAGTQCCYDSQGQLITRGLGSGTDDRYLASSFPTEHFFSDTLSYLSCCILTSNDDSCSKYFNLRPPRRGSNSPFTGGGTWGDPHFSTLDGSMFTFNGYGEYTYLAITNVSTPINTPFDPLSQTIIFNSQIRTTPLLDSSNESATLIRGFSAKSNDPSAQNMSITVSRREMLIIRRGNETLDLDTTNDDTISTNNSLILLFPEMTLEQNRSSGIITLSWFIGVSIQITPITITDGLIINIGISLAGLYQNRTFGLLGLYDNNPDNDLRTQNGTIIGPANKLTLEQIHYQFGQTWSINPSNSLFYYESGDSSLDYTNQNLLYIPSFELPNLPLSQINATLAPCNIDPTLTNQTLWSISQQTCYYDIAVTNDTTLGQSSRVAADQIIQMSIDQRYPPEFYSNLPLTLTINDSTPINIYFTAVSQYTSSIIYTLVRGPSSANFNPETALFNWQNPTSNGSDTIIRVTAQDTKYYLLSTYELVIHIINKNEPSHSNIISSLWIFILINIIGTLLLVTFYFN